ncbi:MAG: SusC/RagA family TonB-linked outer membrane protein [Chitinophagales bacterium]
MEKKLFSTARSGSLIKKNIYKLFLLFLLEIVAVPVLAQSIRVSGTVKNAQGKGLSGVSVLVKGTTTGTTTDVDGRFSIEAADQRSVLVFSLIGHADKEETVGTRRTIDVAMTESASSLDEVVVIGYGTQKKRDVTGAISSISSKQIAERVPQNIFDAIQAQVPGVLVTQESGRPGAGNLLIIRGMGTLEGGTTPLYIVDGAQGVNVDGINPADIESIEILRDAASAAIYGSAGGNGVVIITTKKGKEGRAKIDVRYFTSFGNLSRKVPQANAADRRLLDLKRSSTGVTSIPSDSLNPGYNADNDYQDMLTQTAIRHQFDLGISGASKTLNYYGSLGLIKDKGLIINSWADIARARFNVDFKPNDRFAFGSRIQALYQKENRIDEGRTLQQAIQRPPNFRVYFQDGSLAGLIGGRRNPVAEALLNKNNFDIYDVSLYNYISYNILKDLKFTVDANVSVNNAHQLVFFAKLNSSANPLNNELQDNTDFESYWMAQAYFNYNKTIKGNHTITGVLGMSSENNFTRQAEQSGTNLVTETVLTMNSAQIKNPATTYEERFFKHSYFARLGYAYKGKYLFNSNFRADGSSRFGKDSKWGYFPSASLGWRFSEESFMNWSRKYLDDGKFRISYGSIGNDRIGPYDAILRYQFGSNYYNGLSGVAPASLFGNNKLAWEAVKQLNIGTDLSFLKGRIAFTADYYIKTTERLLYSAPLPSNTGFGSVKVNVGSIQNKGFEFVLSGYPIRNRNLSWNASLNMSFNRNTVKELYQGTDLLPGAVWKVSEGGRLGDFYGYTALGVYAYDESNAWTPDYLHQLTPEFVNNVFSGYTLDGKPYTGTVKRLSTNGLVSKGGDMIWGNPNQDSVIDDNDRTILGNAFPGWTGGLTNTITYKGFTLSFTYYVSWGAEIYNNARVQLNLNATTNVTPEPVYIHGAWWKPGDVTIWPVARNNAVSNGRAGSSLYIEDASFIRLRNIRLAYEVPKKIISKVKLQAVSVFLFGNNLITWTNYKWYDPEISLGGALTPGQDSGRFPRKREFGGGLNVNF